MLVFVAYWNSIDGGFHFDDQAIFLDPYIISSGFGWKLLRFAQTRPLTYLSFHWNYLAGSAAAGFHLVNVVLHAANSVLLLLVARQRWQGSLPFLAAAVFALHPLNTQAVNYVFERATLLAAFFALLSLLFFLRESYVWSVAAFALSLLAKEETIALPAFLMLYDVVHRRPVHRRYYAAMSFLAALSGARLFLVLHALPEAKSGFGGGVPAGAYALTQARVVWTYLRLFFLPTGLTLDHDVPLSQNLLSPPATLPAVLLLGLVIAALAWLAWRRNEPALWALGFFVLLAPSSSVIPVVDLMFEHRTYFPLVCLAVAAALVAHRFEGSWRTPAMVILLAALLAGTIARNRVWHDEESLWGDVIEKSPRKTRAYFQLGQAYASKDPGRARKLFERGLELDPKSPAGHTNFGLVLLSENDPQAALLHLQRALELGGENPLVWNNIGAAQLRLEKIAEGIRAFRRALQLDPCRFDARVNLMRTLSNAGKKDEAIRAAQVPAACRLLPEQTARLDAERRSLY
jgi:tetratricopeptide (TPR) repeat protein